MIKLSRAKLIYYLFFAFLILYCGFFTEPVDYGLYKNLYENPAISTMEQGYKLLTIFFGDIGWSFAAFRFLFTSIALLLLNRFVNLFSDNGRGLLVLIMFFIYPFLAYCTQIRSAFSMCLIFVGLQFLLKNEIKETIKYCIVVVFASFFQITSLIYLIFAIVPYISVKKLLKIVVIAAVAFVLFINTFGYAIMYKLYEILGDYRILSYSTFEYKNKLPPFLIFSVLTMIPLLVIYFVKYKKSEEFINNKKDTLLFKLSIIIAALPVLRMINGNIDRLFVIAVPVFYVLMINISKYRTKIKISYERSIIFTYLILFCVSLFLYYYGPQNVRMHEILINGIYKDSILWEIF